MANPNIVTTANIVGVTAVANVSTVAANVIVVNAASSHLYKVNSLFLSSYAATNVTVTVTIGSSTRTPTNTYVVANTTVPAYTTFVAIDKNAPFYMNEGDTLWIQSNTNNAIHALVSYEDIS